MARRLSKTERASILLIDDDLARGRFIDRYTTRALYPQEKTKPKAFLINTSISLLAWNY
jgi:hypothetical protein